MDEPILRIFVDFSGIEQDGMVFNFRPGTTVANVRDKVNAVLQQIADTKRKDDPEYALEHAIAGATLEPFVELNRETIRPEKYEVTDDIVLRDGDRLYFETEEVEEETGDKNS